MCLLCPLCPLQSAEATAIKFVKIIDKEIEKQKARFCFLFLSD